MKGIGISALVAAICWWPCYAWQGYLGAILWRWFAVGIFHASPVTMWQVVAVTLLLNFFLPRQVQEPRKPGDTVDEFAHSVSLIFVYGFLIPTVTFVSGWIVWRFFL